MTKQYRKPNAKVRAIHGGRAAWGRETLPVEETLKGKTPEQHCLELAAQRTTQSRKGGYFKKESEHEDVCMLWSCNFYGDCNYFPEYSYTYDVCEEIEFTATLNDKVTTAKELAALKGGERVIITANQPVTWVVPSNKDLIKVAMNETTYSFTMPKSGAFNIKAVGRCDPNASKTITVKVDKKLNHALTFSGGLIEGLDEIQTRAYAANVAETESADTFDPKIENKYGYLGLYQFGAAALVEVGLIDKAKYDAAVKKYGKSLSNGSDGNVQKAFLNETSNWVVGESKNKFLNDRTAQDRAFVTLANKNLSYASSAAKKMMTNNVEKTVKYLKMAHLKGSTSASKGIVDPNYDVVDGYKTSMQRYGQGAATDLVKYTQIVREAVMKER